MISYIVRSVRLGVQKSLRHPGAGLYPIDMTHIHEGSNMGLRDLGLTGPIIYVATCNRGRVASINVSLVSDDGVAHTARIENSSMTFDQINNAGGPATEHMAGLQMFS